MVKHFISRLLCLMTGIALLWHAPAVAQSSSQDKLLRAVPEQCLAVSIWNQGHPVPANSINPTDQLLAEPTVRQFVDSVFAAAQQMIKSGSQEMPPEIRRDAEQLITAGMNVFLRGAGGFIVKEVEITPEGPSKIEAVALFMLGEKAQNAASSIARLLQSQLGAGEKKQIGDAVFLQFANEQMAKFPVLVGQVDGCLIIGVGSEFVESTVKRLKGDAVSAWVEQLQQRIPLERRTALGYLDVAKVREKVMGFVPPEAGSLIQSLGLDRIKSVETSSGYVESGMANRMLLRFDGEPTGIFALSPERGLEVSDLAHVPDDAMFAFATSIDLDKQFDFFLERLHEMSPRDAGGFEEGLAEMGRELQIDVRQDLLAQVGPVITLHNAAGDGWLSGLTLTAELKDEERFANTLFRLNDVFAKNQSPHGPRLINKRVGDATITTVIIPEEAFPFEISLCVNKKRLLMGLYPQAIMSAIGERPTPLFAGGLPSASFAADKSEAKLLTMLWVDTKRPFEWLYPLAQMGMAMRYQMIQEFPSAVQEQIAPLLQSINLPPARAIHKHLTPSVIAVRRVADGFEFESQQSLPMMDPLFGTSTGIALFLPAVQQVRSASKRVQSMNNLKQMAIAIHNYESAFMKFPSGFGPAKKDGPPVSWRVKILPFIEQNNLYEMYRMDEPWDSPNNLKVLEMMPEIYRSANSNAGPNETTYLAIGGQRGIFGKDQQGQAIEGRFAEILDGTSNTAMFVDAGDQLAVPWTKPDEGIDPEEFSKFGLMGQFPGGFIVAMGDGAVHFISEAVSEEALRNLFEKNDGNLVQGVFEER
jgi:hypothetical protein